MMSRRAVHFIKVLFALNRLILSLFAIRTVEKFILCISLNDALRGVSWYPGYRPSNFSFLTVNFEVFQFVYLVYAKRNRLYNFFSLISSMHKNLKYLIAVFVLFLQGLTNVNQAEQIKTHLRSHPQFQPIK